MKVHLSSSPAHNRLTAAIACAFMAVLFPPLVILGLNGDALRLPVWRLFASGVPAILLAGGGLFLLTFLRRFGG